MLKVNLNKKMLEMMLEISKQIRHLRLFSWNEHLVTYAEVNMEETLFHLLKLLAHLRPQSLLGSRNVHT